LIYCFYPQLLTYLTFPPTSSCVTLSYIFRPR
jgi:hypothetical protein